MGILWEFQRGNPIGDLIRYTFDSECLHNDAINIYTFLCNYNINHSPPAPRKGFRGNGNSHLISIWMVMGNESST